MERSSNFPKSRILGHLESRTLEDTPFADSILQKDKALKAGAILGVERRG